MSVNSPTPSRPTKHFSCLGLTGTAGLVVIALVALPFVLELLFLALGGFLIIADTLKPADAIVTLSGGNDQARIEEAARLYKLKYARWFIITDTGEMSPDNDKVPYSSLVKKEVEDLGVPTKNILITDKVVSSTWDEAHVVHKLLLSKGMKSLIVVTDPFHTQRTRIIFHDEFSPHDLTVSVHPVPGSWYRSANWWMSEEGRQDTINEYVKLIGYLVFGIKK